MGSVFAAFVNAFILAGSLTLAVGVLLRILPERTLNAATRYLVWWVTLVLVIASPLFYLARTWSFSVPKERLALSEPGLAGALPQLLLLTLLFSSGLMIARMVVSSLVLEQRKRRAVPASARLQARVDEWLARCGSKRQRVGLLSCSHVSSPKAVGPHRPAILIPAYLFDRVADWELDHVCLHEAAHLARREDWALLLQRIIEAVFVWNPLIRLITRRIELERDMACDDLVVSITGEPVDYAACLSNLAELSGKVRRSATAAGAAEQRRQLGRRVETLLDRSRQRGTRVLRLKAALLIVAQFALALWVSAMHA